MTRHPAAIPQPRPLPVLGNLFDIDTSAPVQSVMRLARRHGPIFRLSITGRSILMLSSQELAEEACDETRFSKKVHRPLEILRDIGGDGLFTAQNDEPNWAKAHRLLMPAFGPIGVRSMFGRMEDIAGQMLTRWERFGPDAVIDVADNMTRLTLDTIALCAFDYRFNSFYQNEMHPFVDAMVGALAEASLRAARPEIASSLMLKTRRRYEADIALMNQVADALIAERKADPLPGTRGDLLDLMLSGRDPVTGDGLSDENIRYQLVTFLVAGHETTSGLLSFALYFLLRNPEALAKARDAVDDALGGAAPRVEDLAKLRFIEQVLQESLRLWPTAPAFAVQAHAPTTLAGRYPVSPDDTLFILSPMLHRDPVVWAEPETFRPERFEPEAAQRLPAHAWKPFGNGARACIGRGFAMQEAQLVLTLILQRFDLTLADPDYRLEIAETLTLKPHGLRIRAKRREGIDGRPGRDVPAVAAEPRGVVQDMPSAPASDAAPLLVLYGSNAGSSEAFARRIAGDAAGQGYAATVAAMDAHVDRLPREGTVIVVTASYEGKPPDNARRFLSWIEGLAPGALTSLRYAVFGCGNREWARTYQAIPKRTEAALERAGASAITARGETDASGDFFGGFEAWYGTLWRDLGHALGRPTAEPSVAGTLKIEFVAPGRLTALRLADLGKGRILDNRELVDMTAPFARSKRHIEIALPHDMSYRAGDYLSVLPRNPPADVARALARFGLSRETQIVIRPAPGATSALPCGHPIAVADILSDYVELGQPATRGQVAQLLQATRCPPDQAALEAMAEAEGYRREVLETRLSLLDLLERFPACGMDFGLFLAALPPMRARTYSIASSPLADPTRCALTVAVVDAPSLSGVRRHLGVASSHLAGVREGARVDVAVRPSPAGFHLPADASVPIILVCAGSGIAPFRGFLQERAIQKAAGVAVGRALLFFGVDHPDVDYLYRDELQDWERQGVVDLRPAFSRAPQGDVSFVQHRIWQDRAEVAGLFAEGATVFLCGDGLRMAPSVREIFVEIHREALGVTRDEAQAWADTIEHEHGRYVADVFA